MMDFPTVIAIIAAIASVIAVVQTHRANKFAQRVAEAEGVFGKPEIHINLFNNPKIEKMIWAIPFPGDGFVMVPLKYNIVNDGEKSSNKMELYIRMPKELHGSEFADCNIEFNCLKEIKSKFVNVNDYMHTFILSIDSLLPKQAIDLNDAIFLGRETSFRDELIAKSKDNLSLKIGYKVNYAYAIDLVLMADNIKPISKKISISVIDISKISLKRYYQIENKLIRRSQ